MEKIQGLTDLQLQEADEEKERILAQLQELEKKVRRLGKSGACSQVRPGDRQGPGGAHTQLSVLPAQY